MLILDYPEWRQPTVAQTLIPEAAYKLTPELEKIDKLLQDESYENPIPAEIRRILGLKPGDKILFLQKTNGEIVINNASAQALYKAQRAFAGVAEEIGVYNEDDVQDLVNEVRYGKNK
jgi:antitoxin PrlF